jgi:hypothetical protein
MNEPVGDEAPHHHDILAPHQQLSSKRRTKKLVVQHGMAIEPHQLTMMNNANVEQEQQQQATEEAEEDDSSSSRHLSELFITMCFFARLGFIQPPCCLQCAYHAATTTADDKKSSHNNNNNDTTTGVSISECYNLIPWRIDTSILLHPSQLTTTPLTYSTPLFTAANDSKDDPTITHNDDNNEENRNNGSGRSSNIVFLTCTTAQCLVNGDSYPSLRWDSRNKQLLLF